MDIDNLLNRISFFRNRCNLSARELSLRIGKSNTYINKLECKDFVLAVPVLFDIISELGVSCEEFFADNYMTYKKDKELNDVFNKLSAENKEHIIAIVKKLK